MPYIKGVNYYRMVAAWELEDGRKLELSWTGYERPSTFNDPAEGEDGENIFRIDGVEVDRESLPPEVTSEVIEKLIMAAEEDPSYDPRPDDLGVD